MTYQNLQLIVWMLVGVIGGFHGITALRKALEDARWFKERNINGDRELIAKMLIRTRALRLTISVIVLFVGIISFFHNALASHVIVWGIILIPTLGTIASILDERDRKRLTGDV